MSFISRVSSAYPHTHGTADGQPIDAKLAEERQPGFEEVGVQYASGGCVARLESAGARISMTIVGNPY
jgi:hypothetical protein